MGCFLGCFGISCKRKRRKPPSKVQPGDLRLGSYEPLEAASLKLDLKEEPIRTADSESSKKPKEPFNYKIKKKVSFNLNVQTYEPIPKEEEDEESTDHFWGSDYNENKEEISKEDAKYCQSKSLGGEDSFAAKSYPSNYRYRNCIDSYDEDDEIAYEESELEDEDYDDDDGFDEDDGCGTDLRISQDEFSEKFTSLSLSSQMRNSLTREKSENLRHLDHLESNGTNPNARDRSKYIHSVLNPVENLSQWKAVKAKEMSLVKRQRKENVALEQPPQVLQEIAVDASLSNWMIPDNSCQPRTLSPSKSNTERITPSKESSFDKAIPWRSKDDMPILDITNLEV